MCVSFLVTFGLLIHHLFGKGLLTRFIICLISLLMSLHVATFFPPDIVGGVLDLTVSFHDLGPLQFL